MEILIMIALTIITVGISSYKQIKSEEKLFLEAKLCRTALPPAVIKEKEPIILFPEQKRKPELTSPKIKSA